MATWFQRVFLNRFLLTTTLLSVSLTGYANAQQPSELVIKPKVERKQTFDDRLDNENFEVGINAGIISIEDFESSTWLSAHLSYHITEFFYLKALYGAAEGGETSFEKLSNTAPLLTDDERELTYYGLNIGYNLLPGEVFFGRDLAFNSVFSFELGAGTTEFAGDDNFTVNITGNYRVFFTDWLAWDLTMSDYIFDTHITGETKSTHNLTFNTGVAVFF